MIGVPVVAWLARRACRQWLTGPLQLVDAWTVFEIYPWALQVIRARPDVRRSTS